MLLNVTPISLLRALLLAFFSLTGLIGLSAETIGAGKPVKTEIVVADSNRQAENWHRAYLNWHPNAPFANTQYPISYRTGSAAGPLWSFATTQQSPITGGACLLCAVQDANQAVDGDTTTYSTLHLPAGVLSTLGQRFTFPGDYQAADYVALELEVPNQLISGQLLSGINVQTYMNGSPNNDQVFLNASVVKVQVLGIGPGSTNKFRAVIPVQHAFNGVQVNITSTLAALGDLRVYEAAAGIPATVSPASPQITKGQTATLDASIRIASPTFKWYTTAEGGTPVFTGASFTTPPLSKTTTYYVAASSASPSLSSYLRTPVTVQVNRGPGALWSYADTEESPVTGGLACALCFVDDAALAVDGDTATASRLVLPVGVATSLGQRLTFPGNYQAGDYIALDLEVPNQLVSGQLLSGINIETFKDSVPNNDETFLNAGLVNIQLLGIGSGSTSKFRAIIPIAHDFNAVQVNISSLLAGLGSLKIYEAAAFIPVDVNPDSVVIANNTSAKLDASIRLSGAQFNWYTQPGGGTPVFTGAAFNTPALTRATTYYVAAYTPDNNLRSYLRTPVTVKVAGAPGPVWSFGDDQESPITGGIACAGCTINDPLLAADGDTTTASAFVMPVGVLGTVGQLVKFPGVYYPGDSITLFLETPDNLLTGQLLPGISVETYHNAILGPAIPNDDEVRLDASVVRLELLGLGVDNNRRFKVTIPVQDTFDAVRVNLAPAASLGLSEPLKLYEAAAMVPVTVDPSPATVNYGKTATLTPSIRIPGTTFNWYVSPAGGTPLATGVFTTPPLTRNATYYVEAVDPQGKTSLHRTTVPVTVAGGTGPLWTYGIEQESPRTGGIACALCSVSDPGLAVDEDTTTASRLHMPAGLSTFVGQYIRFPAEYRAGDSVVLFLGTKADPLANASLLSGIQVQTYLGDTPNGDAQTLDASLIKLQLLGLDDDIYKFRIAFPATRAFDGTQVDLVSLVGLSDGLYVYEAAAMMPVQVTRINPPTDTIDAGQTASFEAGIPRIPDAVFSWYETPTGGAPVFTGGSFTTPPLLESKTYYVEAFSPVDGLHSLIRTAVPIVVRPLNNLDCGAATTQTPGTGGLACALCQVVDAPLAVDDDPATASTLQVPIGLLGGIYQDLGFPSLSGAEDSLRIGLSATTGLLDASLLSTLTITLYNGNTEVKQFDNPSLLNLRLLADSTYAELVLAPGVAFNRIRVEFNSVLTLLSNIRLHYAKATPPGAGVADSIVQVCSGGTVTLTATTPSGAAFRWYSQYTGGTELHTGAAFTVSNITSDTTFFVEAVSTGEAACGSNTRTPVHVRLGLPGVEVSSNNVTIGRGQTATFNVVNPNAHYTYNWYSVDTGGTALGSGAQFTTPALDSNAIFYVEADSSGCTSKRTPVYVTISGVLAAPVIIPDTAFVSPGQQAIFRIADPDPALTYRWYNTATGGAVLAADTIYITPANTTSGFVYAEAVNASGEASPRDSAVIQLVSGPDGNIPCIYSNAQESPVYTGPLNICLLCGVSNPGNAIDADTATASRVTSSVGVGFIGQMLHFQQAGVAGDSIRLVLGLPSGLADAQLLGGVRIQTYNAGSPAGDPVYLDGSLLKLQLINGNKFTATLPVTGTYDAVLVSLGGVLTAITSLDIYNAEQLILPAKPAADSDSLTVCLGSSARIVARDTAGITVKWYDSPNSTTALFTGGVFNTPVLTQPVTTYYIETSRNGCANPLRIPVAVNATDCGGEPGDDTTAITICRGSSATLTVTNPVPGATYRWYNTANNSQAGTGTSFTTPVLNANTTYLAEATLTGGVKDTVQVYAITVTDPPTVPVLVNSTVINCGSGPVQLAIQDPQPGITYNWYNAATGGRLVGTGATLTVTPPSGADSVKYYAEAAVGSCTSSSRAAATVQVVSSLQPPVLTTNEQSTSLGGTVTFTIANPQEGVTYKWYSTATGGTPLAIGTSFTTPPLAGDSVHYYVEASAGSCVSGTRAVVTVRNNNGGGGIGDTTAITICTGSTITLNAVNPQAGVTYRWYNTANNSLVSTGTSFTTPVLNANIIYLVEATTQGGAKDTNQVFVITVGNNTTPPAVVAATVKICSGQDATLIVQNPLPGYTYQWYDAATGGSLVHTGPVYTVTGVTSDRDYYVQSMLNNKCASATRTKVSIQAGSAPAAPAVAASNVVTCVGGTATFNIQHPDPAVTYRWYDQPANGTLLAIGMAYTTAGLANTTTFYVEAAYNAGCVSTSRTGVTATVVNSLDAPQADAVTICSGQPAQLAVKNPVAGLIYRWYSTATGGTALFTGTTYTTPPRSANTVYYLEAASGSGCVSISRTPVNVTVNSVPGTPAVTAANVLVCPGQTATLSIDNPAAGLTYRWYTSPTGGTAVTTGATFTTGALNANQQYYVEAVNASGCASNERAAVSVTVGAPNANDIVVDVPDPACPGNTITLTASAPTVPNADFRWYSTATGGTQLATGATFTTPALDSNATYYVEVFTTGGGCASATRKAVEVGVLQQLATPVVTVSDSTANSVTFSWNAVPGITRYEVSTNNGTSFVPPSSGATGTTHTVANLSPNQPVTLQVRALNDNSCQTSDLSAAITGRASNPAGNQVFIPNLFSPNGDGVNDVLMVYGNTIASVELHIYNAWGQEVFVSKDQRQGWDGTMSGRAQPAGVYVYIARVRLQNGTTVDKKGNITLIR